MNLSGNDVNTPGFLHLGKLLANTSSLRTLSLEWNNAGVEDRSMAALTGALAINDSLTRLDLRNNKVTATGAEQLAAMLEKNTTLLALGELQAFPMSHPFHNCVACVDVCFNPLLRGCQTLQICVGMSSQLAV